MRLLGVHKLVQTLMMMKGKEKFIIKSYLKLTLDVVFVTGRMAYEIKLGMKA